MITIMTILIFGFVLMTLSSAQIINRAPYFIHGGDMSRLAVSELTPPGVAVYTLQGEDPENSELHYSISGEYFTVNRDTGVVTLRKQLDRETQDLIEVIISITDEGVAGSEPNTVSLRREIAVLDENDNFPVFHGRPYATSIAESATIGSLLLPENTIIVTDHDGGLNAEVEVKCLPMSIEDDTCSIFNITTDKITEGKYNVNINVVQLLNYERTSSYLITLLATDGANDLTKRLSSKATIAVDVLDVQDQPPIYLNAPYSAAIPENMVPGYTVLTIKARDGDTGESRNVMLNLEDDYLNHFELKTFQDGDITVGHLVTTDVALDREEAKILHDGGIYTFKVRATELINDEIPADSTTSIVTIIITDVDDLSPKFNENFYNIKVLEDIGIDTPLPGLNMIVSDDDVGDNAKFNLSLRDASGYPGISRAFKVNPEYAQGRVPVVIKVKDPQVLDYDVDDISKRVLEFDVVATTNQRAVAFAKVHIKLLDANDHAPKFLQTIYQLSISEDSKSGTKFSDVFATDTDSGVFGELTYALRGFGADKFRTDSKLGGIWVVKPLDYEIQKSYSLTMEAKDGGGKVTTVNIIIDVDDVNDNIPIFEQKEYSRTVREDALSFEPQMFVRATDIDGPSHGDGKVTYSITKQNGMNKNVFSIDSQSGEITMNHPAKSGDTERGLYELDIRATDHGYPPLYSETKVFIRVGVPGNQRPIFKGNYKGGSPGPNNYRARLLENASSGTEVIRVTANDPDGRDSLIQYYIASGAKDNFVIDSVSGIITVSPDARLDLEFGGDKYNVIVYAVDSGTPVKETATTTVTVSILDVNNKPPKFDNSTYLVYVSERAALGDTILKVSATDPDSDAKLRYSIIEPINAVDKTGVALKSISSYDYKTVFKINSTTGTISINRGLEYQVAAVIILTVKVEDINGVVNKDKQVDKAEVTVYIQAFRDDNPIFLNSGWSTNNPIIRITVPEEQPLGTTLLMLSAKEPNGYPVQRFELVREENDEFYVNVGVQSGNIVLSKKLDYESLTDKFIKLKVRALARDYDITRRMSEAIIIVEVQDINDNSPIFPQKEYKVSVLENSKPGKIILNVEAMDMDSSITEEEIRRGFGEIRYALTGENANLFEIDPMNGNVQIAENITLDRERQSVLRFYVIASDIPQGGAEQKTARVLVTVNILDVNDNSPYVYQSTYTAVIPENAPVNVSVVNITATDFDEGKGGVIYFEIIDEGEANGLFQINHETGEIYVKSKLTGKGRTEPYNMRIRVQDGGYPILYSDVSLILYIGDVVSNDGVPLFIRPTLDEVAFIAENSTIGSPVFQVVASDPDDPNLPNGKIMFKFLEDGNISNDANVFKINRDTGLITTRKLLDREMKDSYTLILIVQDLGSPPQQASRILQVIINDIDDHTPHFKRSLDSTPIEMTIEEESVKGSEVGIIEAVDEDIGINGMIDYVFIYGNEDGHFSIERFDNNSAVIKTAGHLDREVNDHYLLTIKCYKYPIKKSDVILKPYNRQDPSERQILIKVIDIDDNKLEFKKDNITLGVRLNVPIDTSLITLEAYDRDPDAFPINYIMGKICFTSLAEPLLSKREIPSYLSLNPQTGEIRTTGSMAGFADGYMEIPITANNSVIPGRETNMTLRIFLLRDRDMLKFVFSKPPAEVRKTLDDFELAVQHALALPVAVNVYDTQFYSKDDNSLDFSSTSSCFQMVGKEAYDLKEMKALLTDSKNEELKKVYEKFHVDKVQHCATLIARADASITQMWVLIISVFIGIAAIVSSCILCCMHSKYKSQLKHSRLRDQTRSPLSYVSSGTGIMNAQSHTTLGTLGPSTMINVGPHDGSFEWRADTTLYHPSTLSRT